MEAAKKLLLAIAVSSVFSTSAFAEESGFFVGIDVSGGVAHGSSDTKNGGGFGGGGVVDDVKFGNTVGIGGHVGYRFNSSWSTFLSYQHFRGDIDWDANFPPPILGSTHFSGTARSDVLMANVAYAFPLSEATDFRVSGGLGVSFNKLSDVVETVQGTGQFVSDVHSDTKVSPAARIAAGIQHKLSPDVVFGLDASLAYAGKFRTGDTRFGNLGTTSINPYEIDDAWRASLTASLLFRF